MKLEAPLRIIDMKLELSLNGQQYSGVSTRASPLERSHVPRFRYEPLAHVVNLLWQWR